jgi:hypothetical protein
VSSHVTGLVEAGIPMMRYIGTAIEKLNFVCVSCAVPFRRDSEMDGWTFHFISFFLTLRISSKTIIGCTACQE